MPTTKRPDLRLADFLVRLSVDPALRASFDSDPEGTLNDYSPPLSAKAKAAILERNKAEVFDVLNINNQNNLVATAARRKARRPVKKAKGRKKAKR